MSEENIKIFTKLDEIYYLTDKFDLSISSSCTQEKVNSYRSEIKDKLNKFTEYMNMNYGSTVAEYVIVPTIAYIDETVRILLQKYEFRWDSFQSEFLERDDLGEYFFKLSDDILLDNLFPTGVYISFWFALYFGFKGKHYNGKSSKLKLYHNHIKREIEKALPKKDINNLKDSKCKIKLSYNSTLVKKNKIMLIAALFFLMPLGLYITTLLR